MACTACWLWLLIIGLQGQEAATASNPPARPGSSPAASSWRPRIVADSSWSAADLTRDAGIESAFALSMAFGRDGSVWVATSDGLRGSDGYAWRRYDESDGLPSKFVRSVHVDGKGTIWAGTDRGAAKLVDGRFELWGQPQGLVGASVRRIRSDSSGSLWFCCDRWPNPNDPAGLTRLSEDGVRSWTAADGLPDSHVYDYHCDSEGRDYAFTSKGLAERRGERWVNPIAEAGLDGANEPCWSAAESPKHGLLVASRGAVYQRKAGRWTRFKLSALINRPFATRDGEILACLIQPDSIEVRTWSDDRFVSIPAATFSVREPIHDPSRSPDWIEDCGEAPDGSIWACDQGALVRWTRDGGEWTEFADLPAPRFRDSRDRVWFVDARGAARRDCVNNRWERLEGFSGDDVAIAVDGQEAWSWTNDQIRRWSETPSGGAVEIIAARRLGMSQITKLVVDGENQTWVWGVDAQKRNRAMIRTRGSDHWLEIDLNPALREIAAVRFVAVPRWGGLWIMAAAKDSGYRLVFIDSRRKVQTYDLNPHFQHAAKHWFVDWNPALLTTAPSMAVDSRGGVWICGLFGVMKLGSDGRWDVADPSSLPGRWIFECFENRGAMWFFTRSSLGGSNGVAVLRDGSWHVVASGRDTPRLLSRNSHDSAVVMGMGRFIHSMPDRYDSGSRTGRFHFVRAANPYRSQLEQGAAEPDGTLWLSFLEPSGERKVRRYRSDGTPPETRIEAAAQSIHHGETLSFRAWGLERFHPQEASAHYRYCWRIDDQPWREFQDSIPNLLADDALAPGPHRLEAQAIDEGGDIDPTPAVALFQVAPSPLQTQTWFLPVVGAVCLALAFLTAASGVLAWGMRRSWIAAEFASRAKSAFLTGMSHELRTPLNAVNGWARMLLESTDHERDQEARSHLQSIVAGSENLRHRVNDILDFTALESGKLILAERPFRLSEAIEQGLASARQNAADKGLRFTLIREAETPDRADLTLSGDPDRFAQILNNLAFNASLYTERGEVIVRVETEPVPASFSRAPRIRVRVTIQDTGDGISQDRLEQLFKPFQRGDDALNRKESGLGLGLAVSRGLAALMNGVILGESQPGRGSAFIFEAPFTIMPARPRAETKGEPEAGLELEPTPSSTAATATEPPKAETKPKPKLELTSDSQSDTVLEMDSKLSILLAEDLETNRRLLVLMLKRLGFEADVVHNGQEAVDAARLRGYDAILMDLQMPVMDGLEASRLIRDECPEHKRPWIVAVTANFADEISTWRDAGIVDHLPKPIRTDELTRCLARAAHWSRRRDDAEKSER